MNPLIKSRLAKLTELCAKHRVKRLSLFGSALSQSFDPKKSDIDFLAEFENMSPAQHAENYFTFSEELQELFGAKIDLVELEPIENPYFLREVEKTKLVLYNAA